jgi:hypothetical protein
MWIATNDSRVGLRGRRSRADDRATMTIASRRAEALPSALRQYNELWRDAGHLRCDYEQQPDPYLGYPFVASVVRVG